MKPIKWIVDLCIDAVCAALIVWWIIWEQHNNHD
jgi:hypothetical protein